MDSIELIGWLGNIIFAVSGIPQAIRCIDQGHAKGVSRGMILLSITGEILAIIYGIVKQLPNALLLNYIVNFISLLIILRYRFFPKNN